MNGDPSFNEVFRGQLRELIEWRRDVRCFRRDALPDGLLEELLSLGCLAPSVGLSEPWRFVRVSSEKRRSEIQKTFELANAEALAGYSGEEAALYTRLKLAGLEKAPVHLAVFVDQATRKGRGLGRRTMPETLEYSVIGAIVTLWLAARAYGVGVGWVSILNPQAVNTVLAVPEEWDLIAYLCIGYPEEETRTPELEREGWERRTGADLRIVER